MTVRMRAMVLERQSAPLEWREVERPRPGAGEIGLKVEACGVCRTDLHILDGELADPVLPLIPGMRSSGRSMRWVRV
ncbi:Alcohol dehydrogenase [Limimaricola hongkongensis DSM 17492]|uniref:Alcohol dehydrogenase n=1 Tax=Limimaricola hongkongensis DSM 17492 TaxID=1122180 RepID=A0A017HF75_9RHOB|nr:alcohol dehydrogenase catalytic domain-containing protein [Limimaricola hongkongensis]EYD72813.1 Alcohol dehydrogenase [Limimaricola hongkongensis DSM 17492]